ncbi:NAD(P)/FAD-dependent oxidoreductase [Actinotalea sp.]|uniref:protoporphyrinogen/coproporphyrinogen oxidase n=1 Tax=Actinotalea sp. TaxID=1872145 RepID=UPI003562C4C0
MTRPGPARGIAVVGGGVAGLVVALRLAERGVPVTVLEARPRTGGAVTWHDVAGIRLDAGADSFATRTTAVADLATELGLEVVAPSGAGAWLHLPQGTVPLPRAGMLGVPTDPSAADVRRVVGRAGAFRAGLDRLLPPGFGVPDGPTTLGHVVRARMGRRVLDRLVGPVAGGVHSADPDALDLDTVLPGLRAALAAEGSLAAAVGRLRGTTTAGAAVAGLRGGMHTLPTALEAAVVEAGGRVLTDARATGLDHRADGSWSLHLEGGELHAAGVVLAGAPGALLDASPGLATLVRSAAPLPQEPVVLATIVLRSPLLDSAPRGTGVLVAASTRDVGAKALTHVTAKWPLLSSALGEGIHVLRLSYGGAGRPVPADGPALGAVLADASRILGVPIDAGQVLGHDLVRWTDGLPRSAPGHRDRVAGLRSGLLSVGAAWGVGAWWAGTGLSAVVTDAETVAGEIVDHLSSRQPS